MVCIIYLTCTDSNKVSRLVVCGAVLWLFILDIQAFIFGFLIEEKMASQCNGNRNKSRIFLYESHKNGRILFKNACA
jgi:hypothetical protein